MEAFSDGVIAMLITILVVELHTPEAVTWQALRPGLPVFLAYVLSFVFLVRRVHAAVVSAHSRGGAALATRQRRRHQREGLPSVALYVVAVASAFSKPAISDALDVTVALIWLVPDRRIEKLVHAA